MNIVGYLVTYYLSLEGGLEHLDRFDTLDEAEDFVDRLEPEEYWINPIVDLSGEKTCNLMTLCCILVVVLLVYCSPSCSL
jgi:hypothetical protein